MERLNLKLFSGLLCFAVMASGCEESPRSSQPASAITPLDSTIELDLISDDGGIVEPDMRTDVGVGVFESQNQQIRFKGASRLNGDIAKTLAISPDEVCKEVGRFDCVSFVHPISLGGVEAYVANLYEGSEETTISAPMIVERIGLQACQSRYEQDRIAGADPHLFPRLELTPDSLRLADPESEAVSEAIRDYFKTILRRLPTNEEIADFKSLYQEIEQHPDAQDPAHEWAVLSCFTLLTSVEFLFY